MIVIEGMDNSGKSTLAKRLAGSLGLSIQESEGPPLSNQEINERIDRYSLLEKTLFVRHPCVSNNIYDQVRGDGTRRGVTADRTASFYSARPTLIYCDAGTRGLSAHVLKDHDTEEHIEAITHNYNKLLYLYRQWAAEHAHFIYRIGDNDRQLILTIGFYLEQQS